VPGLKPVQIKPTDTFFFRGHRDFTAGETSAAVSFFPPRPGTIYGTLRSAYIHRHSDFASFGSGSEPEVRKWMGTTTAPGEFAVKGAVVRVDGTEYVPVPYDCLIAEGKAALLKLRSDVPELAWDRRKYRLFSDDITKAESPEGYFVPLFQWKRQMMDGKYECQAVNADEWLAAEMKTGIALDPGSRATRENMLYRADMKRFNSKNYADEDTGFLVLVQNGPDFSDVRFARLGGENRPAQVRQLDQGFSLFAGEETMALADAIRKTETARLVFITPTIIRQNSCIYNREAGRMILKPGLELEVMAVASGRPYLVGGWDIAANRPKPRYPAHPAGSVFYLRVPESQADDVIKTVLERNITDELAYEGYGWAAVGVANV